MESVIMEVRQRIDSRVDELNKRTRRSLDLGYLLTEYRDAFVVAAFTAGVIVGFSVLSGRKRERANAGTSSNFIMGILSPLVTELLLQRVRKLNW